MDLLYLRSQLSTPSNRISTSTPCKPKSSLSITALPLVGQNYELHITTAKKVN